MFSRSFLQKSSLLFFSSEKYRYWIDGHLYHIFYLFKLSRFRETKSPRNLLTFAKVKSKVFGYFSLLLVIYMKLIYIYNYIWLKKIVKTCLESRISVCLPFWKSYLFRKREGLFDAKGVIFGHSRKLIPKISRFFPRQNLCQ